MALFGRFGAKVDQVIDQVGQGQSQELDNIGIMPSKLSLQKFNPKVYLLPLRRYSRRHQEKRILDP